MTTPGAPDPAAVLRLVLDAVPQGVFWKDAQHRYQGGNRSFLTDLGMERIEDLVGRDDHDLFPADLAEHYRSDDAAVMTSGEPKLAIEEPLLRADGTQGWVRTNKVPLVDDHGRVVGVLGTYEDVSAQRAVQDALARAGRELAASNDELRNFTYLVSHDLRAPLVNLVGFAHELRRSITEATPLVRAAAAHLPPAEGAALIEILDTDVHEALGFIDSSARRMDHLIGTLLQLSRAGRRDLTPEPVDTAGLVAEIVGSLAHQIAERHAQVDVGELPDLVADRVALEQILANVLDNAVRYLDPARPGVVRVTGERRDDDVVLSVADNGRGIAPEHAEMVFMPFRRAGAPDVPGEGMGLATVRALVRRMGGDVVFTSAPGEGTIFVVTLPARPRPAPPSAGDDGPGPATVPTPRETPP